MTGAPGIDEAHPCWGRSIGQLDMEGVGIREVADFHGAGGTADGGGCDRVQDLRKPRSKKALWTVSLSSRVMTLSARFCASGTRPLRCLGVSCTPPHGNRTWSSRSRSQCHNGMKPGHRWLIGWIQPWQRLFRHSGVGRVPDHHRRAELQDRPANSAIPWIGALLLGSMAHNPLRLPSLAKSWAAGAPSADTAPWPARVASFGARQAWACGSAGGGVMAQV